MAQARPAMISRPTDGTGPKTDGRARCSQAPHTGTGHRRHLPRAARTSTHVRWPETSNADESGAEDADADDFDQALDAEIAQLLADLDQSRRRRRQRHDGRWGDVDGTTGDNTRPDGYGKGGRGAVYEGAENKSPDANPKGADVADDTVGGEVDPTATTSGRPGGEDGGEARVASSAVAASGSSASRSRSLSRWLALSRSRSSSTMATSPALASGPSARRSKRSTEHAIERSIKKGTIAATRRALKREAAKEVAKRMRALTEGTRRRPPAARRISSASANAPCSRSGVSSRAKRRSARCASRHGRWNAASSTRP
jgi:hypothetical protein